MQTNEAEIKHLKISLIKAMLAKDQAAISDLEKKIDDLEPGYVYYEEDGTRVKLLSGWFEEALSADDDED